MKRSNQERAGGLNKKGKGPKWGNVGWDKNQGIPGNRPVNWGRGPSLKKRGKSQKFWRNLQVDL